jgi:hypothetical protein
MQLNVRGDGVKFSVARLSSKRTTRKVVFLINAVLPLLFSNGAPAAVDLGVRQKLATASVPFVPNAGQWDQQAAFAAQTFAGTLFVTTAGQLVYSLPGKDIAEKADDTMIGALLHEHQRATERTPGWVLTETFVGADRQTITAIPSGYRPSAAKVSYFIGNDDRPHQRGLDTFERVNLGEVFPGINVQLRATGTNVEKIFTVAPEQDPRQIRLQIGGATKLELSQQGELIAHTDNGPLTYTAPIAFQEDDQGNHQPVAVQYALDAQTNRYGFALAHYDITRPLVIDPLLQSTYLGAGGKDQATALAIHPVSGDVYVAGFTNSPTTTFPGVSGGAQGSSGQDFDAFVSRFNADLTTLIQSSYLGAAGEDEAFALAIHPVSGEVYVAGTTTSPTTTFPGVNGGAQGHFGGGFDSFVSRLSADLTTLIQSSYLGTAQDDEVLALAIHPVSGDIYVAGFTDAPTSTFPGVSGGAQGSFGFGFDGFVSRFSADLTTLIQSSYLGAAGLDIATALAIHPVSGEVYVAGSTDSTIDTFPGVRGGAQGSSDGSTDAFVSRFSADLKTLIQSTYLGAAGNDEVLALAIHPVSGDVYVAGFTDSSTNTFPGVSGGAQGNFGGGGQDAFVSRFSADLATLIKSSYLGAAGSDQARALAIHPVSGDVYVAGFTSSPTTTFPGVSGGAQGSFGLGAFDAFVSRFSADLTTLIQSSYLGSVGQNVANALAIHPVRGEVYVEGYTTSTTTTFPGVSGGAQGNFGGGGFDAFVSRFSLDLRAANVVPNAFNFISQSGVPTNVMRTSAPVQISGLGTAATVSVSGGLGSAFCISTNNTCSCNATPGAAFTTTPAPIANNQFVCARHVSAPIPNALRETVVIVGGGAAKFQTFTGTSFGGCSLDVDGNGAKEALTDGLIILRALFGLTGTAVTNGAIGAGAARTTWAQLQPYLNGNCGTNFAP